MVIKSKDYQVTAGRITLALISDSKSHTWLEDLKREYPNMLESIVNAHLDEIMHEIANKCWMPND